MEDIVRKSLDKIMSETNKNIVVVPITPLKNKVMFADYNGNNYSKDEPIWMEDFNKMNDRLKNTFSDMVQLQEKLICEKLISNRDKALEELVRERLYKLNYKFTNDELFYLFVKNRITKVGFDDQPSIEYLYLDYISEENRGVFLITFSSKIDYDYDTFSGKTTMSIG